MSETPSRFADFRDGFAAIREIMIVIAILALILVPNKVRAVLETAGIRSVAGIEFDVQQLTDAQNEIAIAQQEVEQVMQTLETAERDLNTSVAGAGFSPQNQDVSKMISRAKLTTQHASALMDDARNKFEKATDNIKLKSPDQLFNRRAAGLPGSSLNR